MKVREEGAPWVECQFSQCNDSKNHVTFYYDKECRRNRFGNWGRGNGNFSLGHVDLELTEDIHLTTLIRTLEM